ncbi:hypothetical protein BDZ45DRAFT_736137 [Acephala macrosclerotiorum]|nr:hypothetical protein BDZ45DRAFT_736137 [Acephala macrosclerotiorum]
MAQENNIFFSDVSPDYKTMRNSLTVTVGGESQLLHLHHSVERRSLTDESDEAIYIATLLGMDIKSITGLTPHEDRMEKVYRHVTLDQGIIFSQGRKLTRSGLTWAPWTLLDSSVMMHHSHFVGLVSSKGVEETEELEFKYATAAVGFAIIALKDALKASKWTGEDFMDVVYEW